MKNMILLMIRFYRLVVSPMLGQRCRIVPSCSEYTSEAIEKHGVFKGICLGVASIFRCHPWNTGGFAPGP